MKTRLPSRRGDRGLRLWPVGSALALAFTAAILVAAGVFYSGWELLAVQGLKSQRRIDAKTLFDLVTLSFGVVAGAGALVALVVAYRRQRVDEEGARREATRLHTERFTTAVGQLGDASPAVRLGAVHALAGLADDAPDTGLRQTCIDVLCAYLQLPFTPDPGGDDADREEHHRYLSLRKVRQTILRLIGDHYRRPQGTHRSWQGYDLDLTGVTIDGDMDFGDVTFADGVVNFSGATFSGSTLNFGGAVFCGARVYFGDVTFADGVVNFSGATFSDGMVSFSGATFAGDSVFFAGTAFTGGMVSFDHTVFSSSHVSFIGAEFSAGYVPFHGAAFTSGTVSFERAVFSGNRVSLGDLQNLGDLRLPGHTRILGDLRLPGHTRTLGDLQLSETPAFFGGATLTGGALNFEGARGPAPDGLLDAVGSPVPPTLILPPTWR
ncbi:pentapeptide repeat-containing protein [Streptomyces sp. f150]|uniref:pentapeptide repeat-containing protein n=1 Tax=Streptomyces sp. f150 TaxID=1827699 RepID=UPI000BF055EF|nr:pentapeptide repeat-containing protein [Streptomyces sp. f150]